MIVKRIWVVLLVVVGIAVFGCQKEEAQPEWITVQPGLQVLDQLEGTGPALQDGDVVSIHYTGCLYEGEARTDTFDSSYKRGEPIVLKLGSGMVIPGWDKGLKGLRIGGKRTLIIAPELAYGERGRPPVIPPSSTLLFEVEAVALPEIESEITQTGDGPEALAGDTVQVHYTGWVSEDGARGEQFDSSIERGTPYRFRLGAGQVIPGWDMGVEHMKVGGKRTLTIPPELGYGSQGLQHQGKVIIPPNATLIFDVELVEVQGKE